MPTEADETYDGDDSASDDKVGPISSHFASSVVYPPPRKQLNQCPVSLVQGLEIEPYAEGTCVQDISLCQLRTHQLENIFVKIIFPSKGRNASKHARFACT